MQGLSKSVSMEVTRMQLQMLGGKSGRTIVRKVVKNESDMQSSYKTAFPCPCPVDRFAVLKGMFLVMMSSTTKGF